MAFSSSKAVEDSTWTSAEKAYLLAFRSEVARRVAKQATSSPTITIYSVAECISLDLTVLPKDGIFMVALWVLFLSEISKFTAEKDLKYPSAQDFLSAYAGRFDDESTDEKQKLWQTANWMHILFTFISAKKNKGLSMQVIPKLIEGWDAKYVTGSGQTRLTANRVYIFEKEGDTKANHRGKGRTVRGNKRALHADNEGHALVHRSSAGSNRGGDWYHPKRKRRRGVISKRTSKDSEEVTWVYNYDSDQKGDKQDDNDDEDTQILPISEEISGKSMHGAHPAEPTPIDFWEAVQQQNQREWFSPKPVSVVKGPASVHNSHNAVGNNVVKPNPKPFGGGEIHFISRNERPRNDSLSSSSAVLEHGHTDSDEIEDEDDMQVVFNAFAKPGLYREESLFPPAQLDLMRSQSAFNDDFAEDLFVLAKSPVPGVTAPKLEHQPSWTEIPVYYGNFNINNGAHEPLYPVHNNYGQQVPQYSSMEWARASQHPSESSSSDPASTISCSQPFEVARNLDHQQLFPAHGR